MIISSIDIYNNKVVRLYKGNIKEIFYFGYLSEYLNFYKTLNLKKIHIVSLDNIFNKKKINFKIKNIKVQLGGGINSNFLIKNYLKQNIKNFVLGSVVFKNKFEFKKILIFHKKKILISLDCKNKQIMINGWKNNTNNSIEKIFLYLFDIGIKKLIYTDITKDGTLNGIFYSDISFLIKKKELFNLTISGGLSNLKNIQKIKKFLNCNFIIGISLYKFTIKISEIL